MGQILKIYTSSKLAAALVNELSYVEDAVTINGASSTWINTPKGRFFEEDGITASPTFFEIFDFSLIKGQKKKCANSATFHCDS